MAELDPVVLEFHARTARFQAELRRTTRSVDEHLGRQGARVQKLEAEFRRSSGAIGNSLKGLAATLATAFTGRELAALIDQYTRFQNSLRVAGLEGERLAEVQNRLFETGSRYGVSVNALADLYGKAEQAGRELGASQAELLSLTDAVAQALLVSGVSTEQASGAILGLTQALSSGTVRAEEFNQVNEGGLRVLLEAAAQSERFGGSIAKLRNEVVDGTVSSREFYQAILANANLIEGKASNATLTLSGATQALGDSLARYVGEASTANGATGALTAGIKVLADNLDTLIPAVVVLGTVLTTRAAAGMAAAAVNAVGLRVAALGLAVQLNGTAVAARLAGGALLTAFGGPIGIAIGAVAAGLIYYASQAETAAEKTERLTRAADEAVNRAETYRQRLRDAGIAVDAIGDKSDEAAKKVDGLAASMGFAARQALDLFQKLRAVRVVELQTEIAQAVQERDRLQRAQARQQEATNSALGQVFATPGFDREVANRIARDLAQTNRRIGGLQGELEAIAIGIANGIDVTADPAPGAGLGAPGATSRGSSRGSRSGSTVTIDPAEVLRRYSDQLDGVRARFASAELSLATSAEERAEVQLRQVELARRQSQRNLEDEYKISEAERKRLELAGIDVDQMRERLRIGLENVAAAERAAVEFQKQADIEQRNRDLAEDRGRAQLDALRLEFDLANTESERRDIALRIYDAEQDLLRSRLSSLASSKTIDEADRKRAQIALDALNAQDAAGRQNVERQFLSPLQRFADDAKDTEVRVEEAAVRRIERLNETIADAMTNALGIEDPFLRDLIGIFLDKNVFGPLAEALSAQGGTGGVLGSIVGAIGGLFGRSSGGRVNAGSIYRVNEGASPGRVEAFQSDVNGEIIPLGRMNALQTSGGQAGGVVRVMIEEAPGFAARVRAEATGVAVEVTRQSAGAIVDAAANETLRRANRPTL